MGNKKIRFPHATWFKSGIARPTQWLPNISGRVRVGKEIFDTSIMTFKTSSKRANNNSNPQLRDFQIKKDFNY
ncbi:hypothetical protein CK516_14100 [Nostoc sp. 'Peltigera malacea cyanobiont' DB3992]|nr:hypothetical protein CK516_14100 [Nostoc sp. 'Peltigera malacea cyanobiont' DB3992]